MKKPLIVVALLLSATTQAQDIRLVPSNDSVETALCVAVAGSQRPLRELAAEHGLNFRDLQEIRCNGATLTSFAARFQDRKVSLTSYEYAKGTQKKTSSLQ